VTPHEREAALGRIAILAGLSAAAIARLAAACRWRQYRAGGLIVSHRDPSTDLHMLAAGRVRVSIYSSDGTAVIFTDIRPGEVFGEIAALDRGPRSASVEAIEESTVASLTAAEFERLLLDEPRVAVATMRLMAAEIRRLSQRVHEFSTLGVQNRIDAELLRFVGDEATNKTDVLLSPSPSLAEIASRVTTHREAVSRELSRLAGLGIVRREGADLRIVDLPRLAQLVRGVKSD
jgi:CRP/FNR family transcriptional regulator, cyclic AMP receptor protein